MRKPTNSVTKYLTKMHHKLFLWLPENCSYGNLYLICQVFQNNPKVFLRLGYSKRNFGSKNFHESSNFGHPEANHQLCMISWKTLTGYLPGTYLYSGIRFSSNQFMNRSSLNRKRYSEFPKARVDLIEIERCTCRKSYLYDGNLLPFGVLPNNDAFLY